MAGNSSLSGVSLYTSGVSELFFVLLFTMYRIIDGLWAEGGSTLNVQSMGKVGVV